MSLDSHYDAIVVGSGFGGSVTAYRLAEAGKRVLVLERGRPYPPGSFTRSPFRARESFWDPPRGLVGMYHYWSFKGIDALVSAGLGGGSLIYANVFIRKDENWFVQEDMSDGGYEYWPVNRADLDPHYDRVEKMLKLQQYPFDHEPYASTPKTIAFKEAAEANGLEWFLPKLAVSFSNEGRPPVPGEAVVEEIPNLHGRTRTTCQLCGECDVGCNYGSKNTLDYNYLTYAKHHGAEIRTLADVRRIGPRADGHGYDVTYADLAEHPEHPVTYDLTCDHLILSAGTLGTTNLLLKNRSAFPALSRKLGSRFCGNGDLLTLALNTTKVTDGVREPRIVDPGYGPVITSTARMPDANDPGGSGRGFYLQDAGFPQHLAWILHVVSAPKQLWRWREGAAYLVKNWLSKDADTDVTGHIADLMLPSELSSGGLPLLGMGRDVPDGRMFLRKGQLDIDWRKASGSDEYFTRLRNTSRDFATALGGRFTDNPLWFLRRVITVHPLGGAPMGRHAGEGVVDAYGNVFGHPGLHIADGSVMPGPTGPNPSFTIAALADRFADQIIDPDRRAAEAAAS
ncbi:GMC oxidoreductase [Solirubrobacter soli]|uniref:GMC oxidoreductase n=1 Tax=Solirubrobacter soli TaxID=363832 RepID=UPI00048519A1|nr:GMC family oxidoreductase [Solirubrobacter soli]